MAYDLPSVGAALASPPITPISTMGEQATGTVKVVEGLVEGAAPSAEAEKVTVNVRYTVDCDYEDGPDFKVSQNDKPLDVQAKKGDETTVPVIEIITNISVADIAKGEEDKKPREGASPTLDNKRVKRVGEEWLQIHSPVLSELLRSLVRYYPGQVFLFLPFILFAPPPLQGYSPRDQRWLSCDGAVKTSLAILSLSTRHTRSWRITTNSFRHFSQNMRRLASQVLSSTTCGY